MGGSWEKGKDLLKKMLHSPISGTADLLADMWHGGKHGCSIFASFMLSLCRRNFTRAMSMARCFGAISSQKTLFHRKFKGNYHTRGR